VLFSVFYFPFRPRLPREGGDPWLLSDTVGFCGSGDDVKMQMAETMIKTHFFHELNSYIYFMT